MRLYVGVEHRWSAGWKRTDLTTFPVTQVQLLGLRGDTVGPTAAIIYTHTQKPTHNQSITHTHTQRRVIDSPNASSCSMLLTITYKIPKHLVLEQHKHKISTTILLDLSTSHSLTALHRQDLSQPMEILLHPSQSPILLQLAATSICVLN
jgi:hypothetical protein